MNLPLMQHRRQPIRPRSAVAFLSLAAFCVLLPRLSTGRDGGAADFRPAARTSWIRRALAGANNEREEDESDAGLRVLALGGSVTWGAELESERDAYPYVLGRHPSVSRADNLAIRATGAAYPSKCVRSMIRSAALASGGKEEDDDPDYDVILLEFSINGCEGLPLLVARLRQRYPDAVVIYVDHYSLTHYLSPGVKWRGCPPTSTRTGDDDDGNPDYIHHLPRPENMEDEASVNRKRALYFANDGHHLSKSGHSLVASDILALLAARDPPPRPPRRGSWDGGDQCVSWFATGRVPEEAEQHVELSGGTMEEFSPGKFAYVIPPLGDGQRQGEEMAIKETTIVLENTASTHAALYLEHMTRGTPSQYPKLEVRLRRVGVGEERSKQGESSNGGEPPVLELDPYNRITPRHVTQPTYVGLVPPGNRTALMLRPVQQMEMPFRIVGFSMCAACERIMKKREAGR